MRERFSPRRSFGTEHSRAYSSWGSMRQRCAHATGYADRGITVCARWENFDNFLADMGDRPLGTTLDRIDSAGNYEPGNCRWATAIEQASNRNTNRYVLMDGEKITTAEYARRAGITHDAARWRTRHCVIVQPT